MNNKNEFLNLVYSGRSSCPTNPMLITFYDVIYFGEHYKTFQINYNTGQVICHNYNNELVAQIKLGSIILEYNRATNNNA